MSIPRWDRYPLVAHSPDARSWLTIQANLGLSQNTIEAYGRALEDFLSFSAGQSVTPEMATREHVATYVRDLSTRRNSRHAKELTTPSAGLANATIQQRLTAIRLYYDYLMEEGRRSDNPVGRGRYTPGKAFGGKRERGLIPHYQKLPWIPNEEQWRAVLAAARSEPLRNRVMLAMSYDAALRREELCSLAVADIDPSQRLLRIRAETTKNHQERVVPYSLHDRGIVQRLPPTPARTESRARPFVPLRIAAQPWPAHLNLDMVQSSARDCRAGRRATVHDAHPSSPLPDRLGACRLGYSRNRPLCRPSQHSDDAPLHPFEWPGAGRQI